MIGSHATTFAGRKIARPEDLALITAHDAVLLGTIEYEAPDDAVQQMIAALAARPDAAAVEAIVIGAWTESFDSSCDPIVAALAAAAPTFSNLKAIFVGDMMSEECEISWIQQSDMSPLLTAYPELQVLKARGGQGLAFSQLTQPHNALQSLTVEAGGISGATIDQIAALDLPNLHTLELWLGTDEYGGNATLDQIQALCNSLPATVRTLGLANSDKAVALLNAVSGWPILAQLERLDMSKGVLVDEHVRGVTPDWAFDHLTELDLSENHLTDDFANQLAQAYSNVYAGGQREVDEYKGEFYYYVAVGE